MSKSKLILFLCCFALLPNIYGQQLRGTVYEYDQSGELETMTGATIRWAGTTTGTVSDGQGKFSLPFVKGNNRLVISFVGYDSDTLLIKENDNDIKIVLSNTKELSGIVVTSDEAFYVSSRPILTQTITTEGLRKAACCNLSESFENTVSVDVSYADAVTGAKQIQMLGLAGIYTQIMLENVPYIRGLSSPFGMMYMPGSWMEAINISKGTSSVINGYESITGQIDVNYKKPETSKEKVFVNLFLNSMLKSEVNFNTRIPIKKHTSTMLFFHFENQPIKMDGNKDGFMDLPLSTQVNFMNRWDYGVEEKMEGKTTISYLYETRNGGQMKFKKASDHLTKNAYGLGINTHRVNVISKNGILLPGHHESIATIASFTYQKYDAFYGLKTYNAQQLSGYANVFYENFMDKKERHKIDVGLSYQIDAYEEIFNDTLLPIKVESVPGVFAQYSFILSEKLVVIAGLRGDYNSEYGFFFTPRLHAKWQFVKNSSLRISAGRGYHTPNIYIENISLMNSSRNFVFEEKLKAEDAWNFGASFTQSFKIKNKESTLILDYFYTDFTNQIFINLDRNTQNVYLYNSKGAKSFSHSAQAELILHPYKGIEITAAYRYNHSMQKMDGVLKEKALTSKHKALLSLGYATKFDKWKFNITGQFHGSQRLPNTSSNPKVHQRGEKSPNFFTLNAQITKKFKYFDIYIGGENLTNYKQPNPIISAEDPFSQYFDSSIIWGPIDGAMGYLGMRFTLK